MALDIPPHFYGELITSSVRVVTWNVWGLYGPWEQRETAIVSALKEAQPDIVVLAESWQKGLDSQCRRLAGPLGLPHHSFTGVAAQEDQAALSGVGILSRWPITASASRTLGELRVLSVVIQGPRGELSVHGVVMDAWWLDQSQERQDAVRELCLHLRGTQDESTPLILAGDFNADPDSDEMRLLTGRTAPPAKGLSFYDGWEVAGSGAGHTWSNANASARQLLWPDRRIDYIFSATPRRGGAGHPVAASLLGIGAVAGVHPSDHYAVQADLRY
ncbi:endonuclease/exonuclease/phosphatase family protein [Paenarthrobacter sp. NPDC018779]|uniref:endonuclease/exonuclease/phosphatase family protein n=1 Tax=Paenarthrobacter sp. NPDC018779 TaxID=3364375 RepID=UPI0037CBF1FD